MRSNNIVSLLLLLHSGKYRSRRGHFFEKSEPAASSEKWQCSEETRSRHWGGGVSSFAC